MYELVFQYYGVDWFANLMFLLYVWIVAKRPAQAQWFAVAGSATNIVFAIMVSSVANFIAAVVFLGLYVRAAVLLARQKRRYEEIQK